MIMKLFPKYRKPGYSIICNNRFCDCKGSNFDLVEDRVLNLITDWLKQYKLNMGKRKPKVTSEAEVQSQLIASLKSELKVLDDQKGSLFDFLERKIYDEATFLERSKLLSERIQDTQNKITHAEAKLAEAVKLEKTEKDIIPSLQEALKLYKRSTDQQRKNMLMKSILVRIEYTKEKSQHGDDFSIKIVPRMK